METGNRRSSALKAARVAAISAACTLLVFAARSAAQHAIRINVENVVNQLRTSEPVLAALVGKRQLRIVGAVYSLDTGKVEWLPDSPK